MEDSVKYYATEYMNGGKRYDYAMINFVSDEGITETCPSKILGFVRYNITKGIPTPQFLGNEELLSTTTRDNHTVDGPKGRSLYCLNLNCRAPPGRLLQPDLSRW